MIFIVNLKEVLIVLEEKDSKLTKKIRDTIVAKANYLCDFNYSKHFYFESVEFDNYVEGLHIVPMNRQQEYYFDLSINLDISYNIGIAIVKSI